VSMSAFVVGGLPHSVSLADSELAQASRALPRFQPRPIFSRKCDGSSCHTGGASESVRMSRANMRLLSSQYMIGFTVKVRLILTHCTVSVTGSHLNGITNENQLSVLIWNRPDHTH
jgi:hypothetical protein